MRARRLVPRSRRVGVGLIRFGRLPYKNALPVHWGLDWSDLLAVDGHPAELAQWLACGACDAGLLSTAAYLRDPDAFIPLGACIASRGPVESVLLFGRPPEELDGQMVVVPEESVTSVGLLQLVLLRRYGVQARLVARCPDGCRAAAELVIGDRALERRRREKPVLDLALAWREWTGLPMVFALWVARRGWARENRQQAASLAEQVASAAERGLPKAVARYPELRHYWTVCLSYAWGEDERLAVDAFRTCIQGVTGC